MKRRILRGFLGGMILSIFIFISLSSSWAAEQKYPSKPIEIYNPFVPGGIVDFLNRFTAKKLESYLGVPVVPQNKPGGGGMVLASFIANARPDGYTIGNMGPDHIIQPILLGRASYSVKDFYLIGQLAVIPCVFYTSIDSPWNTFQEFLDYARKNPGVKYGHPGMGTTVFLRAENFNKNFNVGMVNVPFNGDSEVIANVLGKHIHLGTGSVGAAKAQADAGKVRILFCFETPTKVGLSPTIPDLRTMVGSRTYIDIEPSQLMVVPGKTPPEVTQVLEQAWEKVVKDPEYASDLKTVNLAPGDIDGKTFTQRMSDRMAVVKEMLQLSGQLK